MEYRHVGETGLVSSALGLGCLAFSGAGSAAAAAAAGTIRLALDLGINLIVLADFYGGGATERLAGETVASRRGEALIATQGGTRFSGTGTTTGLDGSPAHLKRACDASLERLGLDHIDLYSLSQVDPRVPVAESVGAMAELVKAGKVRHIGLPALPLEPLRAACAEHPIAAVMGEYSLWHRHAERETLPAARQLGIGFLACKPLGRGFLTGRIASAEQIGDDDPRRDDPRFEPNGFRRNRELLRKAEQLAARRDIGTGRLALAWLLAQGDDIVPVPCASRATHVEMNSTAVRVQVSPEECRQLADMFSPGAVAGSDEWACRGGGLPHTC